MSQDAFMLSLTGQRNSQAINSCSLISMTKFHLWNITFSTTTKHFILLKSTAIRILLQTAGVMSYCWAEHENEIRHPWHQAPTAQVRYVCDQKMTVSLAHLPLLLPAGGRKAARQLHEERCTLCPAASGSRAAAITSAPRRRCSQSAPRVPRYILRIWHISAIGVCSTLLHTGSTSTR